MSEQSKPRCAVGGIFTALGKTGLCGKIIFGGEFCGHDSACEHQVNPEPAPRYSSDVESDGGEQ